MWGRGKKKAQAANEPKGYVNDMSPEQEQVFAEFKAWIAENQLTKNPWHVDWFLLKFCRARKFDLEKIKIMFQNYIDYRNTNNLDTILQDFSVDEEILKQVNEYYPRGYCGVDKIGRPVYIERSGYVNATKVWELIDEPTLMSSYYQSYELLQKLHFMACSKVAGKQIAHTFSILDLTNFSIGQFTGKVKALVNKASQVSQDYYPEQLGQLYICNAPYVFSGIWAVIKGFLDEKTRAKIHLYGGNYKQKCLESVEEGNLINFLGGKCEKTLNDNWGPWNDYEVVDGVEPTDVVGIKHKETGEMFTMQDFEALPNYMIGEVAGGQEEEEKKEGN